MHQSTHIITNFPKGFPTYKKYLSNITFYFSQIPLAWRRNKLWKKDIQKLKTNIKTGDIILCANYHEASTLLIPGVVTHAIWYTQHGRCIHATGHGVGYISIRKICNTYDAYMLIRPRWNTKNQAYIFIEFLISKLGKPYDFFFGIEDIDAYFCSELIHKWLLTAEYDSWLTSTHTAKNEIDTIIKSISMPSVLTPSDFLSGNFAVIAHSSNISENHNTYVIK